MSFTQFAHSRKSWGALLGFVVLFEACALTFQYLFDYQPCIMCVYQRAALLGIGLAAVIGSIRPAHWLWRSIAWLVWLIAATWGTQIAHELVQLQTNPSPFHVCSFTPEFWLPLDQWMPWLLQPTGSCTDELWQFAGLTMAQWTRVMFAGFTIAAVVFSKACLTWKK
ncbi:disulfide bond formation protein DsbB [Paraferrimonas haliotis]|uniref:Disulfide bond formation protein B n=1 Tax=Paraferrimonas haliotis TaxID=2013866 RepID=A0AA37WZZ5_9GAMM|nr:disulfide bond formation protein DsbB [Paraferrimonas haliotis]GLS84351.1 disulfide bond formation protein B [Paraferrimonas haliotis]